MSDENLSEAHVAFSAALELIPGPGVLLRATRDARGVITDFLIVDVNESGCEHWGEPRARLVDQGLDEVLPADGAAAYRSALTRVVQLGGVSEEIVLQLREGALPSAVFTSFRARGLGDMALVAFDVSTPVGRSLQLYRTLLEGTADVVVKLDPHGLIDWFLDTTGVIEYQSADVIGTNIDSLLGPDSAWTFARHRAALASPRPERFCVEMLSRSGRLHSFTAVGCRLLDDVGEVTGVVVGFHLVDASTARDRATLEGEEYFKFLATFAPDVVAIERGDVVNWVSPNVAQLIGVDGGDVVGRPLAELIHPEDRRHLLARQPERGDHDATSLTLRMRTAEGEYRWINLRIRDLEDTVARGLVRLTSWRDVQDEVVARQSLLTTERRYQLLSENSTDLVLECDVDAVVRWLSPSAVVSMGWRNDDVVGRSLTDLVLESQRDAVVHQLEQVQTLRHTAPLEVCYLGADGATKWMSQQIHRFRGYGDRHFVHVVTLHDIDDLVTLRRQAGATAHELRLLTEYSSDLIYTVDLEGTVTYVAPSLTTLLGWRVAEVLGSDVLHLIFEDDRPRVLAWRQLLHFGERVEDLEIRVQHASGSFVWMKVRAEPLRDDVGRVIGVVVAGRNCDIEVASSRALRTISSASHVLLREGNLREMLRQICQVAVDEGGYALAWFGRRVDDEDRSVTVVASSRDQQSYLDGIAISWGPGEDGQGPTGRAIRFGHSITVNDAYTEESFRPWQERARAHGFHSGCAIPVMVNGRVQGSWQIYAREQNAFTPEVRAVLEDLALDTGLAIARYDLSDF